MVSQHCPAAIAQLSERTSAPWSDRFDLRNGAGDMREGVLSQDCLPQPEREAGQQPPGWPVRRPKSADDP